MPTFQLPSSYTVALFILKLPDMALKLRISERLLLPGWENQQPAFMTRWLSSFLCSLPPPSFAFCVVMCVKEPIVKLDGTGADRDLVENDQLSTPP